MARRPAPSPGYQMSLNEKWGYAVLGIGVAVLIFTLVVYGPRNTSHSHTHTHTVVKQCP